MAATISSSLLSDHSPWSQRAYVILDDMSSRGNLSARLIGSELKQLDVELSQILPKGSMEIGIPVSTLCELGEPVDTAPPVAPTGYSPSLEPHFTQGFGQNYELNSDQLLELANSLDINGLSFPLSSLSGYFSDNDN